MDRRIILFQEAVYGFYQEQGRTTLPWRLNLNPWGVLVSEFMLQQTQIERVIPYWSRWMARWPSAVSLSKAPLEDALREWNGLGYNRRGRMLWECAYRISEEYGGTVPGSVETLITLAGIGPYSAGAIACFAYNHPSVFIETNIRAALIHFFFAERASVADSELAAVLEKALDRKNPRRWYWALMDYGAALKKTGVNPNRQSAHYTRQSRFEGSFRQRRGKLLRCLITEGPAEAATLQKRAGITRDEDFYKAIESLEKDRMVHYKQGLYRPGSAGDQLKLSR